MEHKLDKAYPKHQFGRFKRIKNVTSVVLQLLLFVTPWINWEGRQMILLDLPGRKLHLFGWTFWPQELHFVFLLLMITGSTVFLITALWGRLWCGYACPQTVFSHSFIFIERLIEGDRFKRMKLEKGPWSTEKILKLSIKWSIWLVMSVFLGITFAGYYTPIRSLFRDFVSGDAQSQTLLIIGFFTFVSLLFFGFLRGRFCSTICPYARFQGALFDRDTVMVNYDMVRGEPRGKVNNPEAADCIDCKLCVQVCPQNIDIRNGVQFECISCAACIDACDVIMEKVSRPKGLIRYVSEAELEGDKTRWVRPRPITYALLLLGVLAIFGSLLFVRTPLALDVVREAKDGAFGRTADQRVSNRYNVRLINKQSPSRTVKLSIEGLDGAELVSPVNPVVLPAEESKVVQVFVLLSPEATKKPVSRFDFLAVDTTDANIVQRSETTFIRGSVRP